MAREETIEVDCPRCNDGVLEFTLEWEPPDPNYGADADGNRGMYVPGYFYVASDCPTACSNGCELDEEETKAANDKADTDARGYDPGDDEPWYDDRW